MNCPFCNEVLEKGALESIRPIVWSRGSWLPLFKKKEEHEKFKSVNIGSDREAYLCPKCGTVVIMPKG